MTLATTVSSQSAGWNGDALPDASTIARQLADDCLTDAPSGRVGLEIEAHCYDLASLGRRPAWDEITEILNALPALPGGSAVSVEPGGAVELSGPPADGAAAAIAAMITDQAVLRSAFADAGLGLVLLGTDPLRPPQRVNPGARYHAMETFFAATNNAVAGAAMMTSTASVQVNLDAGPRDGWASRVWLAHALGPTMVAVAANSPMLGGELSGWCSTRQRVWSQLDSARCGPVLGARTADPGRDWARYALKAPVMLTHTPDPVAVTEYVPFADWADGRVLLGDRRPTAADLEYHLTTLFPPVRPRRWLEIRYLDAVPEAVWPAIVFMLVTLLDDPEVAEIAAEAVEPVADAWDTAARNGLADRRIHAAAVRCVAAAATRAPAPLHDTMARLVALVESGHCLAADFAERVAADGITQAVAAAARGEP